MKYVWKVRYGFESLDFAKVADFELERVLYAVEKGSMVQLGDKFVKSANIISIEPYYNHYTGWYDTYVPMSGEDEMQIKRDCPSFEGRLEYHKQRVLFLMRQNRVNEIGTGVELKQLGMPKENKKRSGGLTSISEILK